MRTLSISSGLVTLIIGLILWLAVGQTQVGPVNIEMIGLILTVIGGIWAALALILQIGGNRSTSQTTHVDNHGNTSTTTRETDGPVL